MNEEKTVWKGTSSPLINVGTYVVCLLVGLVLLLLALVVWVPLLCLMLLPAAFAGFKWLENKCRVYEVTTQRIKTASGIITRKTDELELYRVKDLTLLEPFWMRLYGLGNIILVTNDVSTPNLTLAAIPQANSLREELRKDIEACREQKKVRLAELE